METNYTQEQMEEAFSHVHSLRDWKAPIKATVIGRELGVTIAAIQHFTATTPTVTKVTEQGVTLYLVEAKGYRAGPAGCH
jgi:hypothetical protein